MLLSHEFQKAKVHSTGPGKCSKEPEHAKATPELLRFFSPQARGPQHVMDAHEIMPTKLKRNMEKLRLQCILETRGGGNMLSLSEQESHGVYCLENKCLIMDADGWYLILIGSKRRCFSSTTTTKC